MALSRLKPTYVTLRTYNNADGQNGADYDVVDSADNFIYASVNLTINSNIFKDASQYLVAIERFELSLNGIPFYYADPNEINTDPSTGLPFVGYARIWVRDKVGGGYTSTVINNNAFSLSQLLTILTSYTYTDPSDASLFNIYYTITKEGFIAISLGGGKTFTNLEIQFPRRLNMIIGISTQVQTSGTVVASSYPRLDLGDNLQHIILQSNLQTVSDQVGNVPLQVLTDFAPPSSYANSLSYGANNVLQQQGFETNLRQKAIYNPSERRYLDLISSFAIQNITIDAYYSDIEGNLRRVELPLGGVFDLKLGFYLKN